ncbi:hypothetical protein L2E82_16221 [Cichorium intybus]|uniref:Uncharacterized protein n=1 Tax=Cichorium intybus TaxID=13427 RepID=A0ACB9F4Y6_CICIN|nr:hypothetical protein L2E82_16221 [Cichorium intybus]
MFKLTNFSRDTLFMSMLFLQIVFYKTTLLLVDLLLSSIYLTIFASSLANDQIDFFGEEYPSKPCPPIITSQTRFVGSLFCPPLSLYTPIYAASTLKVQQKINTPPTAVNHHINRNNYTMDRSSLSHSKPISNT